ncbi:MAG TPA: nuclear transport factor 2 family protein [Solirubrobacterales bacterium]|nr:nuclear transport factor 2 family protein [Solirubrobacterales bacterium]
MKIKLTLVSLLAMATLMAAGCGGDDSSSDNAEDTEAITALITEINRVTKEEDAQGFCAVMSPSGVKETFNTQSRCVKETGKILEQTRGTEPTLEIEDIQVDGDTATVDLKGASGGAPVELVKEGGKWYVPLSTGTTSDSDSSENTDG